ncbi:MAG TPA: hypothetical protein VGL53_09320 [Bryobacteraceae bacterium]|jgi:hypothetical protein
MSVAEELVDRILNASRVPPGRRQEIQRELRSHIEDSIIAAREDGCDQTEIEKLVLANFGDAGQIGNGFAWVYRHERRSLRALVFTLSTTVLASALLAAILTVQSCLALCFGTSILSLLGSRHTMIEALDILASVAAYQGLIRFERLFKSHRFQKAALVMMLIDAVLIASCAAAGLHTKVLIFGLVNGLFCRALQSFVTSNAARAGIVVISFPMAGIVLALLRSPDSHLALAATFTSWLAMGIGYQLMTHHAYRVDAALLNGLQRSR